VQSFSKPLYSSTSLNYQMELCRATSIFLGWKWNCDGLLDAWKAMCPQISYLKPHFHSFFWASTQKFEKKRFKLKQYFWMGSNGGGW
jgi:hypothetical protein